MMLQLVETGVDISIAEKLAKHARMALFSLSMVNFPGYCPGSTPSLVYAPLLDDPE
jgi:hypothetical protein